MAARNRSHWARRKATKLPDWAETALNRLNVPPSTVHPVISTLPNGLTLMVQPENVSDSVMVYGHIKNRSELEVPNGKEGMSQVISELFDYGSQKLDRLAFQEALDEIGAEESAGTDFSLQVLSRDLDRGVELLADNELHPAFPQQALDITKGQVARVVAAQLKSPGYLTQRALREALFPKGDPSLREPRRKASRSHHAGRREELLQHRIPARSDHHCRGRKHHAGTRAERPSRNISAVGPQPDPSRRRICRRFR